MVARLDTMKSSQVQGLPQESDAFPRRFRNKNPLILRQIVSLPVLEEWSSHPEQVVQALNQTSSTQQDTGAGEGVEPLLPVMVAEDTKNFMDNPQFTRKVDMTAREIVARVLLQKQWGKEEAMMEVVLPQLEILQEEQQQAQDDLMVAKVVAVPAISSSSSSQLSLVSTATVTTATGPTCPLCENQENTPTSTTITTPQDRRFYYRGIVPQTLYDSLNIPALLASLSLPIETTSFANAPNKDLMRIWVSLAGATTPLHYDRCHGILIQLVGRKRFVVFSHEDTHGLYPYDGISGPGHASKVRGLGHCFPLSSSPFELKDMVREYQEHLEENMAEVQRRWPKIRNTTPWIVDLEPGDALYTPPGFWHEVTSVDHSISITVPWDMDANELQSIPRHMI
ncbi:hypothetical protein BG015_000364 [Linnemannia schmuckeri]|uniref:JmjC domain-containing protein n=1 Tax=Linnemannia schmuckeri TaxID=64567 RepID=A0A9P5V7T7_9FUNG|nr:hypothetical protein BG015_000364 [Linnemannia schmuckeri]